MILSTMKKSLKTSLIVIALALVACIAGLLWLVSRSDESVASGVSGTSSSFEVNIEKPRMDRFLFGILPTRLEEKLLGGELRFDHASRGAKIGSVGHDRLELRADGWDLLIEADAEGRSLRGRASFSRLRSRRKSGRCAADLQIEPWAISTLPRGPRCLSRKPPTCSTAASSSSSPAARMPRRGKSSIRKPEQIPATRGRQNRSHSAGASRACHLAVARAERNRPKAQYAERPL